MLEAGDSGAAVSPVAGGFVLILLGAIAAWFASLAIRLWRDSSRFDHAVDVFTGQLSATAAEGLARGFVVPAAQFLCLELFCACAAFGGVGPGAGWLRWPAAVLLVCFMAGFPLIFAITLFNRPRFLVVPYLRHVDPALLRERRRMVKARRRGVGR
jgi:hypothetical protein